MTTVASVIFALTCIMLTIYTSRRGTSVTEGMPLPPPKAASAATHAVGATPTEAPKASAPADTAKAQDKAASPADKSAKKQ
jgi:preprotein translocase subunit SecG